MLTSWYEANSEWVNEELGAKWDEISKLRKEANKVLEKARQGEDRIIGNALDAKLELHITDEKLKSFVTSNSELLEMVFLVSQFEVVETELVDGTKAEEVEGLTIKVTHAAGEKCERCWKYSTELGTNEEHPTICPRCTGVIK
jgi:isoleucyl-tRNA synthetase